MKLGTLKVSGLKFGSVEFKTDSLKETIKQSINQTPSGHNFQHGANSPFGEKFSSEMTAGIAEFIKQCFDSYSNTISPDSIENPINKFFTEFKKTLDINLKSSFSSLAAVERRSKLLWWKETLYSSSQKRSYRGLDKNLLPILMGSDLNNQIPEITPISVDFLLRDTLYLLIDKQDSGFKFSDYLTGISNVKLKAILKTCFDNPVETEGRISITDFIALLVNDRINIKDFKTRTGINESEQITLVELSVIVLHDLLTQRLIAE